MITSVNNEHIKEIAKLQFKKNRDETNLFIVEGIHLVNEAKKSGVIKEIITIDEKIDGTLVSDTVMKKLITTDSLVTTIAVCQKQIKKFLSDRILILDELQDPGNVGTLFRSAVSFGFNTIVSSLKCVDFYSSKVIRSSQGAIFKVNILNKDIFPFIMDLKKEGYVIYGTSLKNGVPLKQIGLKNKLAVILGNEGNGVKEELLNATDENIFVEMSSNMESLNVAVAGSIIMYELGGIIK